MADLESPKLRALALAIVMLAALVALAGPASAHEDDAADDHPETADIVATAMPESTAFNESEPVDATARMAGALAAAVDCTNERLALVQDNVPWVAGNPTIDPDGLGANAIELSVQGQQFCLLSSSELSTYPLDQFDRIVISGAQNQTFYNNLFPVDNGAGRFVEPALEDWVSNGGTLIANLTDRASGPGNGGNWAGRTFVGGLTYTGSYQQNNNIDSPTHPVVSGQLPCLSLNCGRIWDLDVFQRLDIDDWNFASHGHFQGPLGSTVLLSDDVGPVLIEYPHGGGSVLASMVTTEFRYLGGFGTFLDNRKLLANILSYQYQPDCTDDQDCDGIPDDVETSIGTDPASSDTDSDGLLDPWEVDPSVEGAGFKASYPDGVDLGITQADVFGPVGDFCVFPDENLRVEQQLSCFNARPDPLRADIFLEIDWQDCQIDDCPEVFSVKVDPIHHAPNLPGVGYAVNTLRRANVSNPDGSTGVNLNILIDERIAHSVNCDTDNASQRRTYYGTPEMRDDPDWNIIRDVRSNAVRYLWSGHSSAQEGDCPNPNMAAFAATGFGLRNMESYDFSPFGDVNLAGRDLLLTLGPLWSCPSIVGARGSNPGPCYNATEIVTGFLAPPTTIFRPGIFPTEIDTPNGEIDAPYPIARMLGLTEQTATTQLWERTLAHVLGHALGIQSEVAVQNDPELPGVGAPGSKRYRSSQPYITNWDNLQFAPSGFGLGTLREDYPDYVGLSTADADGDGTPEGDDNCPGIPNPGQENRDIDEFGDACDGDIDGDGLIEGRDEGAARLAGFTLAEPAAVAADQLIDPFPGDTDNDGLVNEDDPDDDNDGIDDDADNCRLVANPDQVDTDGDGEGDSCDIDDDNDGYPDSAEEFAGSDPLDASSTWELLNWEQTCVDGVDNDGDSSVDGTDLGCVDRDGDTNPDLTDTCPDDFSMSWYDTDNDGLGDVCDPTPNGDGPDSLWVAVTEGLARIDLGTGAVEPVATGTDTAVEIAVDPANQGVWTYGSGTLRRYSPDGVEDIRVEVPISSTNEQKTELAVAPDGTVWLVVGNDVVHVSADGTVLGTIGLKKTVAGLAIEDSTGDVWIGQPDSVMRLAQDESEADLVVVDPIELDGRQVTTLTIAPNGDVWVAAARELWVVSGGAVVQTIELDRAVADVVVDEVSAYALVGDELAIIDRSSGDVVQIVDPIPARSGPKATALTLADDGVWISDGLVVYQVDANGTVGAFYDVPSTTPDERNIRDLGLLTGGSVVAPETPFGVLVLTPSDGSVLAATSATITGIISKPGSVTASGNPASVDANLTFTATVDLPVEGSNTIPIEAESPDGRSASTSITITRDMVAPASPTVNQVVRQSINLVRVIGIAEPGSTVDVLNSSIPETGFAITALAGDDGSFVAVLPAIAGHTLAVTATDAAGNSSTTLEVVSP